MADVHDQFEEDAEAELYFDMEEEIYTDCAYIYPLSVSADNYKSKYWRKKTGDAVST